MSGQKSTFVLFSLPPLADESILIPGTLLPKSGVVDRSESMSERLCRRSANTYVLRLVTANSLIGKEKDYIIKAV